MWLSQNGTIGFPVRVIFTMEKIKLNIVLVPFFARHKGEQQMLTSDKNKNNFHDDQRNTVFTTVRSSHDFNGQVWSATFPFILKR